MAVVATHVREEVDLPYGFNVLRNDALGALGDADIIRQVIDF